MQDEIQIVSISGIADQSESKSVGTRIPSDVDAFRKEVIDETLTRQRFNVSREDGVEDLKKRSFEPLQRQQL